ncbi:hypothetical protein SF23_17860 [Streptomyces sp. MBRL 10]|nr:hypothetical protein SF23_17860 [Streptomyces sp. MBRL 10]
MAVAADTAVVVTDGALLGLGLRDGADRWRVPLRPAAGPTPSTRRTTASCTWSTARAARRRT